MGVGVRRPAAGRRRHELRRVGVVKSEHAARGSGASGWAAASERGSYHALRLAGWCFRHLGAGFLRVFLAPIAAYYTLFARSARQASRDYLAQLDRVEGRAGTPRRPWLDSYRHFRCFAEAILDRFSFWAGAYDGFSIQINGRENMDDLIASGRGAVLVGAHLGSFDVLRVISRDAGVRVNVLMFTANARSINQVLTALDPDSEVRLIEIDPSSVSSAFALRRCVERGEFVAVLGDRVQQSARSRVARASFLGRPACFPQGPFLMAMILGLPTILTLALKTGPKRYDVYLETLAGGEPVPAAERQKVLQERVEAFAARVAHYCGLAPFQWFNFYDFWAEQGDGSA